MKKDYKPIEIKEQIQNYDLFGPMIFILIFSSQMSIKYKDGFSHCMLSLIFGILYVSIMIKLLQKNLSVV